MSTALEERPVVQGSGARQGGTPARRAMVRWSWRLFRREWRRQVLVLALLAVAVAATTVGLAVSSNASGLGPDPVFGTANTIIAMSGSDPHLAADIAEVQSRYPQSDVVEHQSVVVPGSVSTVDLRSESPTGVYVRPTVRLDRGRYPTGPGQVAVTSGVASLFGLRLGDVWRVDGRALQVVGLVENPLNLLDEFALVAPGQVSPVANVSILVDASQSSLQSFHLQSGVGLGIESRGSAGRTAAEVLVLVLGTVGLLFVGLLAVAGFTVMAQRRLRALGMLASLGATNRHVRTSMMANGAVVGAASALLGTTAGVVLWIAFAPTFESITNHRVDRFDLPWWAIGATMVLALLTAVGAAWWPARAASRLPVVAALSGRPPRPQPAHRFAALGGMLLGAGLVLLAFADQRRTAFIIGGTVATVIGLLLLAPLAIRAVAMLGSRLPVAVRLALRDLVRYQARSGAALGAVTLALGIAVTIAISAAAGQGPPAQPNLPTNQVNLYVTVSGVGGPVANLSPAQQQAGQTRVDQLATALHATAVFPLEVAYNPAVGTQALGPGPAGTAGGQIPVTLAQVTTFPRGQSVSPVAQLYVATPALLAHYGIKPSEIEPNTDVITSRTDLGGLQLFAPVLVRAGSAAPAGAAAGSGPGAPAGSGPGAGRANDAVPPVIQQVGQLPQFTSGTNALITSHAMQTLGLRSLVAGWFIQTSHPLTAAEIHAARASAGAAGLHAETAQGQGSNAALRNWATAAGALVALGVLGMTVGLIRSETANDLRTLAATGASSTTRRTITAATAGTLALLGGLLATGGAYLALLAWHRSDLGPLSNVPVVDVLIVVIGLPLIASLGGWLLAGREPPAMARRPLE